MPNNEFGDFQTPLELATRIATLLDAAGYSRVLEPTCGRGTFLSAVAAPDQDRIGVEVQPSHAAAAATFGTILQRNVFTLSLGTDLPWTSDGPLLVVGNPPWVTSADLSRFGSANVPVKTNDRGLRGLEARTGSANFDVAEYIWIKLIRELAPQEPTIALLCKTQVARNVLAHCAELDLPVSGGRLYPVDSMRWFGANVDAGLFVLDVRPGAASYTCAVYESLGSGPTGRRFGMVDGRLVADVDGYAATRAADGRCPFVWRQGIKHDATQVMELVSVSGAPHTKAGDPVDVEEEFLFPLVKSTDLFRGRTASAAKWMVVPQRSLSSPVSFSLAPKLWTYLSTHASVLDGRKSSIYRKRPRFCVFGVGDYSFAPYKVAISGMHKTPQFRLVSPLDGRPVVFDDTCYFLSFDDLATASVVCAILRSSPARTLIESLVFWDSKRPVTKKLLQRIDILVLAGLLDRDRLLDDAAALGSCARSDLSRALLTLAGGRDHAGSTQPSPTGG
ncbi:type I restriction-modification system subunit M [Pseudonocardia endophytica]|uniref:N-6 DNA methylase n=1 Tax=Pseudonocardia endophytica TaxID=401976 RepID=A0A4R1I1B4_PSEEN|nr:type I restriction-modification system subunit M [Pseudonocardia endophytica]TCK27335.1 hypothetical protein EV378_3205 [Pseudonocardia endophytica]